jgi:DNA-directed RNA polymerase subunit M/transcription elongation factor TFIIS
LYKVLPQARDVAVLYSTHVEACAAALSKSQYAVYVAIMGRVVYNMLSNGAHIVSKYPVSRVCKLSHKRLDAETAHAQREEHVEARLKALSEFAKQEAQFASDMASSIQTDNAIRCPKCHTQDGITRVTAQMNSGDEGMKTRCLCVCGHRWQMA